MQAISQRLIINVLKSDYPDVASRIIEKLRRTMPVAVLSDVTEIRGLVHRFCDAKRISPTELKSPYQTQRRSILFALVLKFYNPERLQCVMAGNLASGLLKSMASELSLTYSTVRYTLQRAVDDYNIYRDFKNEVDTLFDSLKVNYNG